jgi:hypothetical protein
LPWRRYRALARPAVSGRCWTARRDPVDQHVELEPSSALLRPIGPLAVRKVKAAVARNLGTLKQLLEGTRPISEADQP